MNSYNMNAICIKCGETDIKSIYHKKSDGCEIYVEDVCYYIKPEHILRRCTNCYWEWLEKPLNIKDKP